MVTMYCVNLASIASLISKMNGVKSILVLPSQYDSDHLKLKICISMTFYNQKKVGKDDKCLKPNVYFVDDQAILATLGIHLLLLKDKLNFNS